MDNLKTTLSKFNSTFSMKEFKNSETLVFPIIVDKIPYGNFIEILGEPGKGKSTLALLIANYISKKNKIVAYINGEYSLDSLYLKKLNIDKELLVINPSEFSIDIIDLICTLSKKVDLIILDSLACIDYEDIKKNIGKLIATISHSNCSLIYTNQMRGKTIKKREVHSYGGYDLKKQCSIRLEVEKMINQSGISFEINIIKNKLSSVLGEQIYNFKN
ncbi:MAG: hypothetical protein V1901_04075 [Patescibacteria group bacterium]